MIEVGQTINGYELVENIGKGGFGSVFRANQANLGREVAVKVILTELANQPEFIRRFEVEAQLVARLENLHIVPLYDYWRDARGAFLVMRWLRGGNLKNALTKSPYNLQAASLLLDQIAAGLTTAHSQNVIHRDIKPSNILLDEEGNAYLADFGIAKDLENRLGRETRSDGLTGSLDYLSPEQVRSQPVSPQTDIYSLGVTLYEILTGEHPFPNLSGVERLYKHINDPLPPIESMPHQVADELNRVIQKATAKDPRHRYEKVLAFAAEFRQAAQLSEDDRTSLIEALTFREQEILQGIISGKTNREIAEGLVIEISTVKWYIRQIYRKLDVRNRRQAIIRAGELNLLVAGEREREFDEEQSAISIALPAPVNPYKGLRPFAAADAVDFFGRDALIERLECHFTTSKTGSSPSKGPNRFLTVVGPSGSGKSSLIQAGFVPRVLSGDLPRTDNWFVAQMTPGSRPLDELEVTLIRLAVAKSDELRSQLERDEFGLQRALDIILPKDGSEVLLVIDQFEELFTMTTDPVERGQFLDLLTASVTDPRSRLRLIILLRADFYDRPLQFPQFGALVRSNIETVLPLSVEELEMAIVQPAQRMGVAFDEGLVARIIDDVLYQPGALPLLQFTLTELFEHRDGRLLTQAAYDQIGGVTGALARRIETLYQEYDEKDQEKIRQLFLRLVTVDERQEAVPDTRRRVPRSELVSQAEDEDLVDDIVDTFAAYRLLILDHSPSNRQPTVEVAHEAILREWDRLRQWLIESRDDIRRQRLLADSANQWVNADRDPSYLLRGNRLAEFVTWAEEMAERPDAIALTHQERQFLKVSQSAYEQQQAAEEARQQRELETLRQLAETEKRRAEEQTQAANSLRQRAYFLIGAFVVAVVLAIVAFVNSNLATQNAQEAQDNFALALTQQAEAVNNANTAATQEALAQQNANLAATREAQAQESANLAVARQAEAIAEREKAQQQANLAISRELSLAALTNLEADPELTMMLALEALNTSYAKEAAEALHQGLQRSRVLMTLAEHSERILGVAYSQDGEHLATASDDGTVKIWATRSGQVQHTLPYSGIAIVDTTLMFNDSGNRLALVAIGEGFESVTLHIWDVASGEILSDEQLATSVDTLALALSPDWQSIIFGREDGTAEIWDVSAAEKLLTLSGHDDALADVSISSDMTRVLTTSSNGQIKIWDFEQSLAALAGELIIEFETRFDDRISRSFLSADNERLVLTFVQANEAEVWNLTDINQPPILLVGHVNGIAFAAFHPNSSRLATASADGTAKVWDTNTGEELFTLSGHNGFVYGVAFSPDGHRLATTGQDGTARIWDGKLQTGGELFTWPINRLGSMDLELSPDEQVIALGNAAGPATVWDAVTGEQLLTLPGDDGTGVYRVAFHPDGDRIATAGADGTVRIWDAKSGALLLDFIAHTGGRSGSFFGTLDVAYSPDGSQLATAGADGIAKVWDAETGEELLALVGHTDGLHSLVYSPDGRFIATSSDSQDTSVKVWNAQNGEELYSLGPNPGRAWGLSFSPDGNLLAISGAGGYLKVWDMTTGQESITLTGQTSTIGSVIFTSDGKRLITGGINSISVWDIATGVEVLNLTSQSTFGLDITQDGRTLYASGFGTPAVLVFTLPLEDTIALAQQRLTRTLTDDECRQYLHLDACPGP